MKDSQKNKPVTGSGSKLPPIKRLDGEYSEVEVHFNKCDHDLEIISNVEVRCKKCGAGWTGPGVVQLLTTTK